MKISTFAIATTFALSTSFTQILKADSEYNPTTAACVKKGGVALNLDTEKSYSDSVLKGELEGKNCDLSIRWSQSTSGLNNLPSEELTFDTSDRAYASLDSNEGLRTAKISKCEVKANSIILKYSGKNKAGWGGSYREEVIFNLKDGKIVSSQVKERTGGLFSGSSKKEASCNY
jgi:hypothetical protein